MSDLHFALNDFLNKFVTITPGRRVRIQDFIDTFQRWLGDDKALWTRQQVTEAIKTQIANDEAWRDIAYGTGSDNYASLGNAELMTHEYIVRDGRLVKIVI